MRIATLGSIIFCLLSCTSIAREDEASASSETSKKSGKPTSVTAVIRGQSLPRVEDFLLFTIPGNTPRLLASGEYGCVLSFSAPRNASLTIYSGKPGGQQRVSNLATLTLSTSSTTNAVYIPPGAWATSSGGATTASGYKVKVVPTYSKDQVDNLVHQIQEKHDAQLMQIKAALEKLSVEALRDVALQELADRLQGKVAKEVADKLASKLEEIIELRELREKKPTKE